MIVGYVEAVVTSWPPLPSPAYSRMYLSVPSCQSVVSSKLVVSSPSLLVVLCC